MTSSVGVGSSVGRHGHRLVYVVLVQSLLIAWLSLWAVEDYLNNVYVRAYVDGTIQADALLMGLVLVIGIFGSVMGLVRRRSHQSGKSLELVLSGTRGPVSTPGPRLTSAKVSHTMAAGAAGPAVLSGSSGASGVSGSREAGSDLHPAVAALKAELSERRVSLGLMSATIGQDPGTASGPKTEGQSLPVPDRPRTDVGQAPMGQMPRLAVEQAPPQTRPVLPQTQPSTVVRLMPRQPFTRPTQPTPVLGGSHSSAPVKPLQPMNLVRPPDPARPTVAQPSQPAGHVVPRNVSTVITGILPSQQQKKKDADGSEDKQSSQ